MECTVIANTLCDSSNEDVIQQIQSLSELQQNVNKIEIVLDKCEVTTKLVKESNDLEKINEESFLNKYDQQEGTSTGTDQLQKICSGSIINRDNIHLNVIDVNTSDIEKADGVASDSMSNRNNHQLSSEKICEEISEILKQSDRSPEICLSPHALFDTDENTTQLRFDMCELSDEKSLIIQTDNLETRPTENPIADSSDCEFLNEKSHFSPHNDILESRVLEPYSTPHTVQGYGNVLNHSFVGSETLPSVVEESSLDSGIVSLDDPEPFSSATSSDNEAVPPPVHDETNTGSNRKRLQTCVSSSSSKRLKQGQKKSVTFEGVTIYYFPRKQSFVTIPSQGGATLGMSLHHIHSKQLTLDQHKRAVACHRRLIMKERERQQEIKEKIKELKDSHPDLDTNELMLMVTGVNNVENFSESSSDEDCEEEKCFSDDDEEDDYFFLQPISTKKRRLLLRMSGVQRIDAEEKFVNKLTRESREVCGCDCKGTCLPAYCQCALAGIPCQVDRESFPCGCVTSGCHNESGRVEFDSDRVTNHYFQTMRRLRLEAIGNFQALTTPKIVKTPHKSPYVSSDGEVEGIARAWFKPAAFEPLSQASAEFQHCLQQSYQEEPEQSPVPASSSSSSDAWPTSYGDNSLSPIPTSRGGAGDSLNGSFMETLKTVQPIQDCSFLDSSLRSDLNSSLIVSEKNGLDYLVPQPVSTATSPPAKAYLDNSCGDFGSSFSSGDEFVPEYANKIFCSGLNAPKQMCKLDPIASFLPLNQSSSPKRSGQDPLNFLHPTNPLEVVGQGISPGHFGGDGKPPVKSLLPTLVEPSDE